MSAFVVRHRTSRAPRPRHDVTNQSIDSDMDRFKADACGEALRQAPEAATARLRNSPRRENWLVTVQLTQTMHVWLGLHRIGG